MQSLKENWQNLSDKTKKMLIAIVAGTAVISVIGLGILLLGQDNEYSTLFTGMNREDAQEVVALLQEQGVDYHFNDKNGAVQIPAVQVDQVRAELLSQGYPKSGFTYDMYRDNTGLMTTESDKKQYTLYELQDRLGAQIQLFEGVRDAKITIAEAAEQKYALGDDTGMDASASVVVTMQSGRTLSKEQASAIKNLIARAVKGMNFTNVSVFDAETMMEVDGEATDGAFSAASDLTSLTSMVENNIAINVRRVLEKLYGSGKVAVSVKGTLNMERLIQESTQYSTPEKIDEEDKTGLLQNEAVASENSGTAVAGNGGVVGADANADTPRYTAGANGANASDTYANSSATREWLYNSIKEQRQIDPGVLENTTIGIVIDTNDTTIREEDLIALVANSAGINVQEAGDKITIIRALSPESANALQNQGQEPDSTEVSTQPTEPVGLPLPIIIAIAAGGILILLLLILLILRARKKKKSANMDFTVADSGDQDGFPVEGQDAEEKRAVVSRPEEDDDLDNNEEIINLRMQRSMKLKQNIGDFVDQNPQIAAKLVQSWLRGEESGNGGNRGDARRKQK